jgi:hypothetical protein
MKRSPLMNSRECFSFGAVRGVQLFCLIWDKKVANQHASSAESQCAITTPPESRSTKGQSTKSAIQCMVNPSKAASIPHVSLVQLNAVPLRKIPVLLLKASNPVMLFLIVNIRKHRSELAGAERKRAAVNELEAKFFVPRCARLQLFCPIWDKKVVARSRQNRCQVSVHARADFAVQSRFMLLGANLR